MLLGVDEIYFCSRKLYNRSVLMHVVRGNVFASRRRLLSWKVSWTSEKWRDSLYGPERTPFLELAEKTKRLCLAMPHLPHSLFSWLPLSHPRKTSRQRNYVCNGYPHPLVSLLLFSNPRASFYYYNFPVLSPSLFSSIVISLYSRWQRNFRPPSSYADGSTHFRVRYN